MDSTGWIAVVLVVVTTAWMTGDAAKNKISIDSKPYSVNNGQWAWMLSGLLLWIATFPYYLYKRSQMNAVAPAPTVPAPAQRTLAAELSDLETARRIGAISQEDYEKAKAKLLK